MENWLRTPLVVVPDDSEAVQAETDASPEEAEAACADELNLGYDISLVNECAIVIATLLNALRIVQWHRYLRSRESVPVLLRHHKGTALQDKG